jgi:long-chain acyl-CoA synthetase
MRSAVEQTRSLAHLLRQSCSTHGDKPAYLVPSKDGFTAISYNELYQKVFAFAKGLQAAGVKSGDRVAIISETCAEWAITDWACQTLGAVVVPIYPTLPPKPAQYILQDSDSSLVVAQTPALAEKAGADYAAKTLLLKPAEGFKTVTEKAEESNLGQETWEGGFGDDPSAMATIIYTSGTTGNPKGVMLSHANFINLAQGIGETLPVGKDDVFLSFLPLSHVFERFAGHVFPISIGATVGYAGSLKTLANDMQEVKPTVMLCVPRFLEATRGRIMGAVESQGGLKKKLFDLTLKQAASKRQGGMAPLLPVLDSLVGKKIRERTGGRLRFFVSGGAALAPHVSEFYLGVGLNVLQGYGLTETTAASCVNRPDNNHPETVGEPLKGVEVKIDKDGEILIKGAGVMQGYYNLPEETKAVMTEDGWFRTGDIGELKDGRLKITDRKKDLLILANGKNIAPQPIENVLKRSDFINEVVLFGDGMESVIALIVPEFDACRKELEEKGLKLESDEELAEHAETQKLIKSEVAKANQHLADYEKVKRFRLAPKPFSIDTGELTPSLKVKKAVVKQKYSDFLVDKQR